MKVKERFANIQRFVQRLCSNIFFQHMCILMGMVFSFLILDVALRYFSNQYVGFYRFTHLSPLLFSVSWIFLVIGICYLIPSKGRQILYPILVVLFNILVIAQMIHMKILGRFFGFSDLLLTGEASNYFGFALSRIDWKMIILILLSAGASAVTVFFMHKSKPIPRDIKYYGIVILITLVLFGGFRLLAIQRLGKGTDDVLSWEAAMKPKNVYDSFNNQNKNIEVAGIYEQAIRNVYLYFKDTFSSKRKEDITYLQEYFLDNEKEKEENEKTGVFEGKNLILILLESIDSWLVDEEVMPTLTSLMDTGWNFTNRYAPPFGGGQTINTEFAVNTGLYSVSNTKAIYNFDSNDFSISLPSLMKEKGYTVNSIHTNTGNFYNRNNFHLALGYEHHYALDDMKDIDKSYNYYNDSSLMKSDDTYRLIVPEQEEPFMSFIITYSGHVPYDSTNDRCVTNPYQLDVKGNSELSCIRNLAKETDEMLRLLIERLEKEGKLEDTVLALFTDHYAYGYSDEEYIKQQKQVDNIDLLQNVPFVIWSSEIESATYDYVMDSADIMPTLANMFGLSFDTTDYMGEDVFYKNRENFVYFPDGSWYDGTVYYNGRKREELVAGTPVSVDSTVSDIVTTKMKINDMLIKNDYYRYK